MEEIKRIRCGNVNCFLLTRGETAVLVDTARTAHRQTVLDACKPYQVRLILLTHGHVDHVQNAAKLSALGPRTIHFGHGKSICNRNWI